MPSASRTRLPFEVWALVAGAFTVALGYGVVAPVIPQYAREFGVSNFAASAIVSAFALMRLVGAPIAGRVVNRFGERRIYTAGILIVAVSTGACALANDYPQLLLLRAAGGIGSAMFTIAATGLLIKVSPTAARGRVASVNAAGFLLGMLLGPVLGALVAGFGMRAPFVFYFFTLLLAAALVWFALRNSAVAALRGNSAAREVASLPEALRRRPYRAQLVSVFAFGWASFGVRVSLVPLFVAASLHGDASAAAWVLAAYAAGNAALIFPSGAWNDRFGRRPLLVAGMGVTALAYLAFPWSPALWVAIAVMLVAGAGSALVNPAQQAVLADVVGHRSGGGVVAVSSMASDLGAVLGPLAAGAIADAAGFGWAFSITAVLLAVSALVWLLAPESSAVRAQSTEPSGRPSGEPSGDPNGERPV